MIEILKIGNFKKSIILFLLASRFISSFVLWTLLTREALTTWRIRSSDTELSQTVACLTVFTETSRYLHEHLKHDGKNNPEPSHLSSKSILQVPGPNTEQLFRIPGSKHSLFFSLQAWLWSVDPHEVEILTQSRRKRSGTFHRGPSGVRVGRTRADDILCPSLWKADVKECWMNNENVCGWRS